MPKYLSSDNDPLYRFHRWQANLRVLEVTGIKSIPYVPLSHPFVERLTTLRPFDASIWIACCSGPLQISKTSCSISGPTYNQRTHSSLEGRTPDTPVSRPIANLRSLRWQPLVTYIRHQWLRNFPKTLDRCVSGQVGKSSTKPSGVCVLVAARFADPIVSLPPVINSPETLLFS